MCSLEVNFKVGVQRQQDPWAQKLLWALGAAGAASMVTLGGLASVQDLALAKDNNGEFPGIDYHLSNKTGLRFYWYHLAMQFVVLSYALYVVMTNKLTRHRNSVVGLLSITAFLFMLFTNFFYAIREQDEWSVGVEKDRINALLAGSIMTATLDSLAVLLLGWEVSPAKTPEVAVEVDK